MLAAIKQYLRIEKRPAVKAGSRVFWVWIAYQTIKGSLTTSLIWIPLLATYWK